MACHPVGEHVVFEFVRSIILDEESIRCFGGITVTTKGHIVVAVIDEHDNGKIIVL